jgi:hypothetical protein
MFQRKLIVVLGLVAMLALTAGMSQASLSRVEGMNLTVAGLSVFTDDYVNIYYFPTSVVRQNNLVLGELGNNPGGGTAPVQFNDQSFTLIRNFPRFGAIAFQMKERALNSAFPNNLNHEQLDMIWGRGFEKIDFAVRLDITNSKFEDASNFGGVATTFKASGADFSFDPYPFGAAFFSDAIAGTGVELNTYGITPAIAIHMNNDNRFEGAVTYRKYTLDRSETAGGVAGEKWEDDGSASYAVAARLVYNQNDKNTWYPAAWYVNDDLSWKVTGVTATPRSADEKYKYYGVGISNNMKVNDNNLLLWGVNLQQAKHTYERTDNNDAVASGATKTLEEKTTMAPLVFAAIETDATRWLKVRMGASRALFNTRTEFGDFDTPQGTETTKERGSDFNFALGTGIRWNNLDIDMTLNEKFPLSGGWVMSGDNSTPFTRASATYHF